MPTHDLETLTRGRRVEALLLHCEAAARRPRRAPFTGACVCEERVKRREEEIVSLQEALKILNGEDIA